MKISVTINSNIRIKGTLGPPIEIELEGSENTLEDALKKLSAMYPDLRLIENGERGDDLGLLSLNGEDYFSFPEGLKKKINDGDAVLVEVYIDVIAGG